MLWELLVTEGHVRAARLRHLALPAIAVGVLLVFAAFSVLKNLPYPHLYSNPASAMQQRVSQLQQPIIAAFAQVPGLNIPATEVPQLIPEADLPDGYQTIKAGMDKGSFPPDLAIKEASSPADFWSWNWPHDQLISLSRGDLRAFGAIIFSKGTARASVPYGQQIGPHPVRWLAIFRKFPTGWDNVAIQANGFIAPPDEKTVSPQSIPITLRRLMNLPDSLE